MEEEIWCDLVIQQGKSTGNALANTDQQLSGMGSETWSTELCRYHEIADVDALGRFKGMKEGNPEPNYFSVYAITTDNGSDERGMRKIVDLLLALIPWVLVLELMCHLHQVLPDRHQLAVFSICLLSPGLDRNQV